MATDSRLPRALGALACCAALAGCAEGAVGPRPGGLAFAAPGWAAGARGPQRGPEATLDLGHRRMAAGDAEGALRAFRMAAIAGAGPEALAAMGTANLALGRLGQAEPLLRRAVEREPRSAGAWNNLGVLLLETRRPAEAAALFERAYALGDGASEAVRANLLLAMAEAAGDAARAQASAGRQAGAADGAGPGDWWPEDRGPGDRGAEDRGAGGGESQAPGTGARLAVLDAPRTEAAAPRQAAAQR